MSQADAQGYQTFRPGWRWRMLMTMLGAAVVGSAVVFAVLASDEPWLLVLAIPVAVLGIVRLIRVNRVLLGYNYGEFLVSGVLWSRRIELDQIDDVD